MSSSDGDQTQTPTTHRPDVGGNPTRATPSFPSREDCWSEEATRTLIEAWGSHYLELNKGNLRQKHWQEVADAVNSAHGLRRTDVQCKNRIDTTKKKYKVEKARFLQSNGRYRTAWAHFDALDSLIGDSFGKSHGAPNGVERTLRPRASNGGLESPRAHETTGGGGDGDLRRQLTWTVPVGPRSKRSWAPGSVTERNFSVMAAAAAAMAAQEGVDNLKTCKNGDEFGTNKYHVEDNNDDEYADDMRAKKKRKVKEDDDDDDDDSDEIFPLGYKRLAEAITRLAEVYERVEESKQRQMIELEKHRMQFVKDLEIQRMKAYMDSQIQIEKIKFKRAKRNGKRTDGCL